MQKFIRKFIFVMFIVVALAMTLVGCGKKELQISERKEENQLDTQNYRKYTLEDNIYLKEGAFITIQENTLLDLNGHAIIGNNSYVVQVGGVNKKAHLVLQDSAGTNAENMHYLAYSKYTNSYSRYGTSQQGGVDTTNAPTFLPDSYITVHGGLITGGSGAFSGGGVYVYEGSRFDMLGGTIAGNNTSGGGGGVYVARSAMFSLRGGTIKGNSSAGYGGGIYVAEGKCNIYGGDVQGNTAVAGGGGVYTISSELNITDGNIAQNSARFGGGVNAITSLVSIFGGNIRWNLAQEGGGMSAFNSNLEMQSGTVQQNVATKLGGGIKFAQTEGNAVFNLHDGQIIENAAKQGGGIYLLRASIHLNGGEMKNNKVSDSDKNIYNFDNLGTVYFNGCKIEE